MEGDPEGVRLPVPHRADGRDSSSNSATEHSDNLSSRWTLETDACGKFSEDLSVREQTLGMYKLMVVGG